MRNMKALVVDDSKVVRLTMQKKLEALGVGVDLAGSGLEALNYLEQHRPDVIFMDHMMPELDGFEATRRIKAAPATRDIPVIILSGSDDVAFVREARAVGALDVITKPPAHDAIERILVSLHQTATATAAADETLPATQPTPQTGATAQLDQASVKAMIEAGIAAASKQLRGDWLIEFRARLEAEFENERQLQRTWTRRIEQRLDQSEAGMADIARVAAESEALRQQLHTLETRLLAVESAAANMATPTETWLEAVDRRVGARLTELGAGAERQAARLDELRQELVHRIDERHARDEQVTRDLAGRIEVLSEAMQQRVASTPTLDDAHIERLGTIEQRLADLEAKMDRLREHLQPLGQAQDTLDSALSAQSEGMGAKLDQRFVEPRAEIDAALQSAAAEVKPAMTAPAADILPAAAVDQDLEARLARRLADEWNGRWQPEVQRLQGILKTLTVVTAAGGAALLTALIVLAL